MTVVACSVTRTELSLAALDVNADPYAVTPEEGFRPGRTVWRRHRVGSPFVHGELDVHQVKQHSDLELAVEVDGATQAALWPAVDTLVAAFEQSSYTVTLNIDGTERSYTCGPADYALGAGGVVGDEAVLGLFQVVRFSIPRDPVPLVGRL